MKALTLTQLALMCGGRVLGEDVPIDAVATDTRALPAGRPLFVAIKGEQFDGHDHVATALAGGCVAALTSRDVAASIPQLRVADTLLALKAIATAMQRERRTQVIAITGSNGKTTVRALTQSILQAHAARTHKRIHATPGNRNNEIGMPLAVMDAPENADIAIYEMGTGAPGDIDYLATIAPPNVALVNNVAPAHLERMGTLLAIADTKAAVYDRLQPGGVAAINADDAFAPYFAERAHGHRIVRFALDASADVTARDCVQNADGSSFQLITPEGEAAITLQLPGRHNIANALAAAALAMAAGASLQDVQEGLHSARAVSGRLVTHRLPNGAILVDDSYNANPGSVAAGIDTLVNAGNDGEAWLVLGDMRELGADAEAMHAQMGRAAKAGGIRKLYTLGPLSAAASAAFGEGAQHFDDHATLAAAIAQAWGDGVRVLVKGSRGSAMDKVVRALLPADATHGEAH